MRKYLIKFYLGIIFLGFVRMMLPSSFPSLDPWLHVFWTGIGAFIGYKVGDWLNESMENFQRLRTIYHMKKQEQDLDKLSTFSFCLETNQIDIEIISP